LTYPTTPSTPESLGLYGRDGFGHGGEAGYFENEIGWSGKRDDDAWREHLLRFDAGVVGGKGRYGKGDDDIFLEHCRSKHCFFGCGGSCLPLNGYTAPDYDDTHHLEREYDFDTPRRRSIYLDSRSDSILENSYSFQTRKSAISSKYLPSNLWI
jgi:hypothetical protein